MSGVAKCQVTRKGHMSVCPLTGLGTSLVKGTYCSNVSDLTLRQDMNLPIVTTDNYKKSVTMCPRIVGNEPIVTAIFHMQISLLI